MLKRGIGRKNLTLCAWLPTILPCMAVPEAWVQPEALKGQRGSFGRQPSLAPSPRGVCSWRAYYSVFPPPYVTSFFVSAPIMIAASPVHGYFAWR